MKKLLRKEIKVNRIFFIVVFLLPLVSFIFAFVAEGINFDIVIISTSISLIVMAFVIPILLKLHNKYKMTDSLIFMGLLLLSSKIPGWFATLDFTINYTLTSLVLLIIALIVYSISMKVSLNIYRKMLSRA